MRRSPSASRSPSRCRKSGNLGGGGFMLIRLADGNRVTAIDYRETAPASATRDMFLDEKGKPDPQLSRYSGFAVGVPGTVAGLAFAHEKYGSGKFTLAQLIAPAIPLARDGFEIDEKLASFARTGPEAIRALPASAEIFLKPDGSAPAAGKARAARSRQYLADHRDAGPGAFYEGLTAQQIALSVQAAGGRMSYRDLAGYRAQEREPVRGSYRGYEIYSMPPPSSGGVHLVQMLNILEGYDLRTLGAGSAEAAHLLIEAMKPAYADRSEFLGDPDFTKVPLKGLVSKRYAEKLRGAIDRDSARPAVEIRPGGRPRTRAITPRIFPLWTRTATRSPTPTRSISSPAWGRSPRRPAYSSTTSSTISPRRRTRRTPTGSWAAPRMRRVRANARCRR